MPQRAEAERCRCSFDETRPHVKAFRGKLEWARSDSRPFLLSFLRGPARRPYQTVCSATAKDQLVKHAEARIFWARAQEADMVHMNSEVLLLQRPQWRYLANPGGHDAASRPRP